MSDLVKKLENAFLAQAVGDAVGDPLEFNRNPQQYDFEMSLNLPTLTITDDTQMALFGLSGLIYAKRDLDAIGIVSSGVAVPVLADSYILPAYLAWYDTQTERHNPRHPYPLAREGLMCQQRAPGSTCLGSLSAIRHHRSIANDSMGNGAVMRSLPFVFAPEILGITTDEAIALAVAAGKLTHGHVESSRAVLIYMCVGLALRAQSLPERQQGGGVIQRVLEAEAHEYPEVVQALDLRYTLGNTFTALPALQLALRALYQSHNGDEAVLKMATVHPGDSDTVGAIAMGLYGLVYPAPNALVKKLVEADIIRKVCALAGESDVGSVVPGVQGESVPR